MMPVLQIHAIYQLINSVSLIKFKKENRLIQMMAKENVLRTAAFSYALYLIDAYVHQKKNRF